RLVHRHRAHVGGLGLVERVKVKLGDPCIVVRRRHEETRVPGAVGLVRDGRAETNGTVEGKEVGGATLDLRRPTVVAFNGYGQAIAVDLDDAAGPREVAFDQQDSTGARGRNWRRESSRDGVIAGRVSAVAGSLEHELIGARANEGRDREGHRIESADARTRRCVRRESGRERPRASFGDVRRTGRAVVTGQPNETGWCLGRRRRRGGSRRAGGRGGGGGGVGRGGGGRRRRGRRGRTGARGREGGDDDETFHRTSVTVAT